MTALVLAITLISHGAPAATPADPPLESAFAELIQPFLKNHCTPCHAGAKPKGNLDLARFNSLASVANSLTAWERVLERLEAEEMPPSDAPRQPNAKERDAVIHWIQAVRDREQHRNAGDPGTVLARRLNHAEFDNTIRDLTGIDIRPTREFPIDPANEAGFDNSGESLAMSPMLLEKYLAAARHVASHVVLLPDGLAFAPYPVVADTDRDKYCVRRIVDFYERYRVDYADYFVACWRFENRDRLGNPDATIQSLAKESRLSSKYLTAVHSTLTDPRPGTGPLGMLRERWRQLLETTKVTDDARHACEDLRDFVVKSRRELEPKVDKLKVRGISDGSQPLVLWRNRQLADRRMRYSGDAAPEEAACLGEFCRVFPDAFYVAARGAYFDPKLGAEQRLLTAGFHLMQGYFRDDAPLMELVLDDSGRAEIDGLWQQLYFATGVLERQYKDFIFFERAEPPRFIGESSFDFARSEDKDATSEAKMQQLRGAYLAKAKSNGASDTALDAIAIYFDEMSAEIRRVESARQAAEPAHIVALLEFAERAYRRPMRDDERRELVGLYRSLRDRDGLSHEDSIRDSFASVLMSPHFCYRIDSLSGGDAVHPLSDVALASRLSYFLWSSMPDDELLAHAASGDLHEPGVIVDQARRMLRDDRSLAFAQEFAGNWLDFRRFEEHNAVDRERFATFTNELRQAMFEEPIRFFADVVRRDQSILSFIDADYTFVNPVLARHYGLSIPDGGSNDWTRAEGVKGQGRGGLLPMAVFLTKNSPGLRTSPVKRGYWVVRRLLGEHIPAPPPEVPELPRDEAATGDLTLPQLLARHRDSPSCAKCHQRFDSIGLVFEGYGPIGERRDRDLAGRPVDTRATFPDGSDRAGLDGLRQYLTEQRQQEFVDNFCRKLLAYALGRTLLLSDRETLENMQAKLASEQYRFGSLIESIVTSRQFLNRRERDDSSE
jgi:hypothetical protein